METPYEMSDRVLTARIQVTDDAELLSELCFLKATNDWMIDHNDRHLPRKLMYERDKEKARADRLEEELNQLKGNRAQGSSSINVPKDQLPLYHIPVYVVAKGTSRAHPEPPSMLFDVATEYFDFVKTKLGFDNDIKLTADMWTQTYRMHLGQNFVAVTLGLLIMLIKRPEDFKKGNLLPEDMYQEGDKLLKRAHGRYEIAIVEGLAYMKSQNTFKRALQF
jgi:hypothetical protein